SFFLNSMKSFHNTTPSFISLILIYRSRLQDAILGHLLSGIVATLANRDTSSILRTPLYKSRPFLV
ncbi:MAG TPA: hypothetical protein VIX17_07420, partial [Pyrinomonadaceae bacterium]